MAPVAPSVDQIAALVAAQPLLVLPVERRRRRQSSRSIRRTRSRAQLAGGAADRRIGEVRRQRRQRPVAESLPGVGEDEDLAGRRGDPGVERQRLAAGGHFDEPDGAALTVLGERRAGSVGRAVGDHDDLAAARIRQVEQVGDAPGQARRFIARGEDDGDRGPGPGRESRLVDRPGRQPGPRGEQCRVADIDVGDHEDRCPEQNLHRYRCAPLR